MAQTIDVVALTGWKKGDKIPYMALAKTMERIEDVGSTLEKNRIFATFLERAIELSPNDLTACIYLCSNQLGPAYEVLGIETEVDDDILIQAIAGANGQAVDKIKAEFAVKGDLGIVAQESRITQQMLFKPAPLTVPQVLKKMREVAAITGSNSMDKKVNEIQSLLVPCKDCEARYLVRGLGGKLCTEFDEQLILTAVANAFTRTELKNEDKKLSGDQLKVRLTEDALTLKTAYCECPNYDKIIKVALEHGISKLPELCTIQMSKIDPLFLNPAKFEDESEDSIVKKLVPIYLNKIAIYEIVQVYLIVMRVSSLIGLTKEQLLKLVVYYGISSRKHDIYERFREHCKSRNFNEQDYGIIVFKLCDFNSCKIFGFESPEDEASGYELFLEVFANLFDASTCEAGCSSHIANRQFLSKLEFASQFHAVEHRLIQILQDPKFIDPPPPKVAVKCLECPSTIIHARNYCHPCYDRHQKAGHFKPEYVLISNIVAAKAVADAVRTSLGPRGMDKMIQTGNGEITNDGATILAQMSVNLRTEQLMIELAEDQYEEAGDGTTTVVLIAGALLDHAKKLLDRNMKIETIVESFQRAATKAEEVLEGMSYPLDIENDDELVKLASTILNSKAVSQYSWLFAPMAVSTMKKIVDVQKDSDLDLNMIKVVKMLGGSVEESELINGALIEQKSMGHGGPSRVDKAKVGLIQFQISSPKTNIDNQLVISDNTQMNRDLTYEERAYLLDMCKQIKKTGCNVLLIQKSILRDAISELALRLFAKMKIMVIKDIEREDIEFYSNILGCRPVASADHFTAESLGSAELVEEITTSGTEKVVKVTGLQTSGKAVSILLRGSNKLVLDEADRSLRDALCVLRCLIKKRALLPGGGAPEMEVAVQLRSWLEKDIAKGTQFVCMKGFAEALEVVPYTLAENAGLSPIVTVTELRNQHANGKKDFGMNVRKGFVSDIKEENVLQPLLVTSYAIKQAAECVCNILNLDDQVAAIPKRKSRKRRIKMIDCAQCGEYKKRYNKDLCSKCYAAIKEGRTIPKEKLDVPVKRLRVDSSSSSESDSD